MPFDIVAWLETQTATALSGVAGVPDQAYEVVGDDIRVLDVAPYLAGLLQIGVSTPKYVQMRQPKLKPSYPFYRATLSTDIDHRPGFTNMFSRPLPLFAREKLNAYVQNASAEYSAIVAWLASGPMTLESLAKAQPTNKITGYADSTLSANVWNTVTPTWDEDLPEGRYAVISMKAGSYLAAGPQPIASRLVLLDTQWRPGVITSELAGDKTLNTAELSGIPDTEWPLMPDISFTEKSMPKIEMLSLTADTDHIFELLLRKIG